jgi:chaperonin cofactor prefoldin
MGTNFDISSAAERWERVSGLCHNMAIELDKVKNALNALSKYAEKEVLREESGTLNIPRALDTAKANNAQKADTKKVAAKKISSRNNKRRKPAKKQPLDVQMSLMPPTETRQGETSGGQ